jgi:hypothetical protein
MIVNPEKADNRGYFWAVTKATPVEGSAVTRGSNSITPTISNNMSTTKDQNKIDYKHLMENFKLQ